MRRLGVWAAACTLVALLTAVSASAGGNGSFTQTMHLHRTAVQQIGVLGITPPPDLPSTCPVSPPLAFIPTTGNAIQHLTVNGAGDGWFTTTFEGSTQLFEGFLIDQNGDVAPVGDLLYTGHLTTWFGSEDNNKNGVFHATLSFHGTSPDGNASLSLHAAFDVTMNANGTVTATPTSVNCS